MVSFIISLAALVLGYLLYGNLWRMYSVLTTVLRQQWQKPTELTLWCCLVGKSL